MRVFWIEIKYIKCAAKLLNRNYVNRGGLYLSDEGLWVSVAQKTAELLFIKVGGHTKIYTIYEMLNNVTKCSRSFINNSIICQSILGGLMKELI